MSKCEVIFEVGLNHSGNLPTVLEYIRAAKDCGCETVKFQYYLTDTLCLNRNSFDSYKLLDKIRMHRQWIPIIADECKRLRMEFLCTAFDKYSVEDIDPYVVRHKIASPEACDIEYVRHVAGYGKPLIISTGKATYEQLDRIFESVSVPVTLLYCVSKYPASPTDYDLNEMDRLRQRYKYGIGLSDHTNGLKLSIQASEKGACIIERHFKLDNQCVDANVSLFPNDMAKLVSIINNK